MTEPIANVAASYGDKTWAQSSVLKQHAEGQFEELGHSQADGDISAMVI